MPEITPSLSQQISDLIANINTRDGHIRDWLAGTVDGGPNNDGFYPLADGTGATISVPSPAKLADMASGPAAVAVAAKTDAETALQTTTVKAGEVQTAKTLAEAAKGAAIAARDLAQSHRSFAATDAATARYWAELAQAQGGDVSGALITITELAQDVAAKTVQVEAKAAEAAQSAANAAIFDPENFDRKSDALAANRITGTLSLSNIPVLPSQKQFASSGGLANLTSGQQAEIGQGSIVTTTDGYRWVYSGEGSKTVAGSYTVLADTTPDWNQLTNVPTTFLPSPHSHIITDTIGLQNALDAKLAATSLTWANVASKPDLVINGQSSMTARGASGNGYTVIAGGNADYTGSIGFHQSDGTRLGYIGGAHSSNKFIPFVAENGGAYYFNTRPLFGGMVPWDAANLSPVTTNTAQTIFSRKVFKDLTSGTAATAAYSVKPLEVQSLAAGDDALMSFHIPGVRAAMFGLSSASGEWQVGTPAGVRSLYHTGNFDPSTKLSTTGGNLSGNVALQKATPMLYFNDTGASGALGRFRFYSAANNFYFTRNTDASGGWGTETAIWQASSSTGVVNFLNRPVFAGQVPWDSGNFDPATKANVSNPAFSGTMLVRASSSPAGVFALTVGNGTDDTRSLFRGGNSYPLGVSQGTGGTFYLGATNATSPTLQFCNVSGTVVATLAPDGVFTTTGSVVANGYLYAAGIRVPITTYSNSAPSGGVDGDVHIVW